MTGKGSAGIFQKGRPGEEEEESLVSQFSSFSSVLSPTTCREYSC